MKTIAERVRFARERKGWTQAQLAINAGLVPSTIGNIESGSRKSKGSLPMIAKALEISHDWIAYGTGSIDAKAYELSGEPGVYAKNADGLSNSAIELAKLYDLIPESERVKRAIAYNSASAAILDVLQEKPPS